MIKLKQTRILVGIFALILVLASLSIYFKPQPQESIESIGAISPTIEQQLQGKNANEKSQIKSHEIAKLNLSGIYISNEYGVKVEIIGDVVEIDGGIELFARAWRGNKQLGFGKDGSVEIERFRIINPPILVDDLNGEIVREWTDQITSELKQRKLREDPAEATRQDLAHTITVGSGRINTNIIKGKRGSTHTIYRPDAGSGGGNTSVDGFVQRISGDTTWNTLRTSAGTSIDDTSAITSAFLFSGEKPNAWRLMRRGIYLFDTSDLGTDTIDSATLSFFGQFKNDPQSQSPDVNVYASTPANNDLLVTGDYLQTDSTAFSSAIAYGSISTVAYNDFSLNASGLSAVVAGISKFATRNANFDATNNEPQNTIDTTAQFDVYNADEAGTTKDPKLVVVHSEAVAAEEVSNSQGYII